LGTVANTTGDWLHHWSRQTSDNVFQAERSGPGWPEETYSSCHQKVRVIAASLLARGMNEKTPIAILSGNSIDHGLLMLAA